MKKKILNYHLQACKIKYKKKCKPDYQFGEVCDNFPYDVSIGDVSKNKFDQSEYVPSIKFRQSASFLSVT